MVVDRLRRQLLAQLARFVGLDFGRRDFVEASIPEHGLDVILECQALGVYCAWFVVVVAVDEEPLLKIAKGRNLADLLSIGTLLEGFAKLAFVLLSAPPGLNGRGLPNRLNAAVGMFVFHVDDPGFLHASLFVLPRPQSYAHC